MRQHHAGARSFAAAAAEGINRCEKRGVARRTQVRWNKPAVREYTVDAVLQPVCRKLFVDRGVVRSGREVKNKEQPQGKSRSERQPGIFDEASHRPARILHDAMRLPSGIIDTLVSCR